jgi:hypothetical protein
MSRCLCKNAEGAVLPFQVEALEDGVDDSVDAVDIHKADHGPRPSSHLHETTLDDIRRAQFLPQMSRKVEEREQYRQIALQLPYYAAVGALPAVAEARKAASA